ncbi:MAG: phenylalanine--tRNA ligase subunit alpha [Myxococcales bacterium]|nr:phenylalanine--tRNA ligase subunit alpha [Myxococcales bacterium]MCB9708211.1 phenylalanine--tRNA ligase subunit alpha [Myxococcales bacterium]
MSESSDAWARVTEGLRQISEEFKEAFSKAKDEPELRRINATLVGSKGTLTGLLKLIPALPSEARRDAGQEINRVKREIEASFAACLSGFHQASRRAELTNAHIDVTLPGRGVPPGSIHVITQTRDALVEIFGSLGFEVADGPEIDLEKYNFHMLGFPKDHPAMDMQDTFFVSAGHVLRTHTSTIQIREMLQRKPPLAIIAPGAVYRRDDDATHSPMFFQIEGFLVGDNIAFSHLKGILRVFVDRMFGEATRVRFRPSYFPFVEPGAEMDIGCLFCQNPPVLDCKVCKSTRWIEILGCGMIHPVVFEQVGYDPERYTGFAFGMGIDRIAMLKRGVDNIRRFYENDLRFLKQF